MVKRKGIFKGDVKQTATNNKLLAWPEFELPTLDLGSHN